MGLERIPLRILGWVILALVIGALLYFGPAACNALLTERQAHRIDQGQNKATLDSLDIANQTEAEREALADEIEAENKALADAIRAAEPGDSNDATMKALCQTRTYRDTPDCVALKENADAP